MTAASVAIAMNAVVDTLEPWVIYRELPIEGRREFMQVHALPEQGLPRPVRRIRPDLVLTVLGRLTTSEHNERLHRAATQYNEALKHWRPGRETLAISPLWIAVETLTDVALRVECARRGMSETDLATDWGVDTARPAREWRTDLVSEVRRRLIFDGDVATASAARHASDAWEHGFLGFDEVRRLAASVRDETARYVRHAFLRLSGVTAPEMAALTVASLDRPKQYFPLTRYLKGTLVGDTANPAATDSAFPLMDWTYDITKFERHEDRTGFRVSFEDHVRPHIANDIGFQAQTVEVWGPAKDEDD
jgi:hypothetical protein